MLKNRDLDTHEQPRQPWPAQAHPEDLTRVLEDLMLVGDIATALLITIPPVTRGGAKTCT